MRPAHAPALLLLAVGLLQPFGYVLRAPTLRLVGYLSAASPLPLVFNQIQGHEYWSSRYELELFRHGEAPERIVLGPAHFAGVGGPHLHKTVYPYALALVPVPSHESTWSSILRRGLCAGPLLPVVSSRAGRVASLRVRVFAVAADEGRAPKVFARRIRCWR
ncbi:MAG: hypothetical protein AAGA56_28145 [Myxococcota bacterium]